MAETPENPITAMDHKQQRLAFETGLVCRWLIFFPDTELGIWFPGIDLSGVLP